MTFHDDRIMLVKIHSPNDHYTYNVYNVCWHFKFSIEQNIPIQNEGLHQWVHSIPTSNSTEDTYRLKQPVNILHFCKQMATSFSSLQNSYQSNQDLKLKVVKMAVIGTPHLMSLFLSKRQSLSLGRKKNLHLLSQWPKRRYQTTNHYLFCYRLSRTLRVIGWCYNTTQISCSWPLLHES